MIYGIAVLLLLAGAAWLLSSELPLALGGIWQP